MVKSTGDGLKRGHIGGMVFRVVNGKQVIQEMMKKKIITVEMLMPAKLFCRMK